MRAIYVGGDKGGGVGNAIIHMTFCGKIYNIINRVAFYEGAKRLPVIYICLGKKIPATGFYFFT